MVLITGCEYGPGDEVALHLTRRERRVTVSDEGAAVARAGRPRGWRLVADRLERELDVNISRQGAVSLPVVAAGPGEEAIVKRVARASLSLYQDLLELEM